MKKTCGVSAAHPIAVDVGLDVMKKGGNAADAAIAVSIALGVVEPYASGVGGGGNMLIYPKDGSAPIVYDYRETAPTQLNERYNIGVPGLIKGMEAIAEDYGRLTFEQLLEPSIHLAENGFRISDVLSYQLKTTKHGHLVELENFYPNGIPLEPGDLLIQKDLANNLKHIAKYGSNYFYKGELGEKLVQSNIGLTQQDLEQYDIKIREPLKAKYGPYELWSAPAPVGGAVIIQTLALAERLNIDHLHVLSPTFMTSLGDILQKVMETRRSYNGDPEFNEFDEKAFIQDDYIVDMATAIKGKNKMATSIKEDINNTTHFSVIDADGMVVSTTNTLSHFFGSGVNIEGIFLNNQMQNFSDDPLSPNKMERGKRCESIIAPTVISENGVPFMAVGASGAGRIPTILSTTIIKYLKQGYSLQHAISEARFFISAQDVKLEKTIEQVDMDQLKQLGYQPTLHPDALFYGGVQALSIRDGKLEGAADPRRGGTWKEQALN